MKNKRIVIPLIVFLCSILAVVSIYYYMGLGFGQAVVKTVKGVEEAKKDWKENDFKPVDTIKTKVVDLLESDSVKLNK